MTPPLPRDELLALIQLNVMMATAPEPPPLPMPAAPTRRTNHYNLLAHDDAIDRWKRRERMIAASGRGTGGGRPRS